jgi:hypothetical protein
VQSLPGAASISGTAFDGSGASVFNEAKLVAPFLSFIRQAQGRSLQCYFILPNGGAKTIRIEVTHPL